MTAATRPGPIGVLVMAHGTPATPAEIEPFYTSIRRGRPPTPELLADLVRRYEALGGTSPLAERTRAQVDGLAAALEADEPGAYIVRYGAKHTSPRIEDGMRSLRDAGVEHVIGLVLTPHQSSAGSRQYLERAAGAAAEPPPLHFDPVASWHRAPGLAELLAERLTAALARLGPDQGRRVVVLFTAHSVPERALSGHDPYADEVQQSAADIAAAANLDEVPDLTWEVAWQSAGRTDDRWLGPDLLDELHRAAAGGATAVVVCPVGFVADHLEVLYDLDIEAAGAARSADIAFVRTASLNDDPRFLTVLAGVVRSAGSGAGSTAVPATGTAPAPPT